MLTPEREAEIRELCKQECDCHSYDAPCARCFELSSEAENLLAEIDRLREESEFRNEAAKEYAEKCGIYRAEFEYSQKQLDLAVKALEEIKINESILDHDDEDSTCFCPSHIASYALKQIRGEDVLT